MKQIISLEKEIAFKTMIGEISSISLEHTLKFETDANILGDLIISGTYKMTEASTIEEYFHYAIPVDIMLTNDLEEETRKIEIANFTYDVVNEEVLVIKVDILVKGVEKITIPDEIEEKQDEENIEEDKEDKEEQEDNKEDLEKEIEVLEDVKELIRDHSDNEEKVEEEPKEEVVEEVMSEPVSTVGLKSAEEIKMDQEVINQASDNKMTEIKENTSYEEPVQVINNQNETDKKDSPVMNSIFNAFANTDETYTTYSVYILRENDNLDEIISKYNTTKEELSFYNNLDDLKSGDKLIIPTSLQDG